MPRTWTPEQKRVQSERMKKLYEEHPEHRRARSERMRKYCAEHPLTEEQLKVRSERMRKRHAEHPRTEEQLRAQSESLKRHYVEHPEIRRAISEGVRKSRAEHPLTRTKEQRRAQSEFMKKKNTEHPLVWTLEQRRAMSESMRKYRAKHPEESQRIMENARKYSRYSNTIIERETKAILESLKVDFKHQGKIRELSDRYHCWDFLIPSMKIAIEVDGCWFHRCPIHCPNSPRGDPEGEKRREC